MAQTSTLCHDEALKTTPEAVPAAAQGQEPSERVIRNILEFSRNLEVKRSSLLEHVIVLKS